MKSHNNTPASLQAVLSLACVVTVILCFFAYHISPADAQVTRAARVDITDAGNRLYFGDSIYITPDPQRSLNADIIAQRHEQNLRGTRAGNAALVFGLNPSPVWLVFTVTNQSMANNWILDFGQPLDGRNGLINAIKVINYTTRQILLDTTQATGTPSLIPRRILGTGLSIVLPPQQTQFFVVYLEMSPALPATLAPSLVTPELTGSLLDGQTLWSGLMSIVLIGVIAAFLGFFYVLRDPAYALSAGYFTLYALAFYFLNGNVQSILGIEAYLVPVLIGAITITGLILTKLFLKIPNEDYTENMILLGMIAMSTLSVGAALVLPIGGALGGMILYLPWLLASVMIFYVAIYQAQKNKKAGYFWAAAWFVHAAGLFITMMAYAGYFMPSPGGVTALWLALIPQAVLCIMATARKYQDAQAEERQMLTRENRAAQSLARLKQSKESADQARLLRVIERERELMAELREREMQRTEEMRKAKDMADQANQAKSAFLAVVSHEIRTPMNGILGILRLLKDTKLSKDQNDYLMAIQKSGDTMMVLLNDILDFEKIETGNMKLERIDFDLPKLVQGVVTLMSGHALTKGLTLSHDIGDDVPRSVVGDPTRLRQVLLNLVNNALKFTETGTVTIRVRAKKAVITPGGKPHHEIYCAVEDTGIGISEDAQEKLFKPFEQAHSSTARKYGGTGLGLAICQRLIESMGSSIRLTSQPGQGSTFFFTLTMADGRSDLADESETATTRSALTGPTLQVLIVEDNEINRKVLQSFLEKEHLKVTTCDNGEEAITLCAAQNFDVILMDINLRGMSGFDVTRQIRSLPNRRKANVPIIATTGNVSQNDINLIFENGMNYYIPKPIDFEKLMRLMRDVQENKYGNAPAEGAFKIDADVSFEDETGDKAAGPATLAADISALAFEDDNPPPTGITTHDDDDDDSDLDDFDSFDSFEELDQTPAEPLRPVNPQAAQTPSDLPLDEKMLAALLDSLGKLQITELMHGFFLKADEIVGATVDAELAGDLQSVCERGHELKGMAANFGITTLSTLAKTIEDTSRAALRDGVNAQVALSATSTLGTTIAKLPAETSRAKNAVMAWLARQP